jgi:hypothetical protein
VGTGRSVDLEIHRTRAERIYAYFWCRKPLRWIAFIFLKRRSSGQIDKTWPSAFNLVTLSSCFILQIPAVILLGAFSIVVYHRIILGEERYLEETFGEPYLVYKSKVRRYL